LEPIAAESMTLVLSTTNAANVPLTPSDEGLYRFQVKRALLKRRSSPILVTRTKPMSLRRAQVKKGKPGSLLFSAAV
jgi:hypothetical protein